MRLRFPVYLIANREGVLVVKTLEGNCILLFHKREQAERHIRETTNLGSIHSLQALAVPDIHSLQEGIKGLPSDITCAIWDAQTQTGKFSYMPIHELLEVQEQN